VGSGAGPMEAWHLVNCLEGYPSLMSAPEGVKDPLGPWLGLLDHYRIGSFPADEVITGTLRIDLNPDSPQVVTALEAWDGTTHCGRRIDGRVEVALTRPLSGARGDRVWLHLLLLLITVFTTLTAGALLGGIDPFESRLVGFAEFTLPFPTTVNLRALWTGIPFSLTLMAILMGHELGHYMVARAHGVRASLPYFIPFPAQFSIVGTFGAFIRIRSPAVRRSVLFDIGIAGPLVSLIIGGIAMGIGLSWSTPSGFQGETLTPFLIHFGEQPLGLGSSLLANALAFTRFPMLLGAESIALHPVAFAGWVGLLLTSLNLLPLGQLDGGHVCYGLFGNGQKRVAQAFLLLLVPLGLLWWGWWLWGGIAVVLSRGRLGHPPVLQPDHPLDPGRILVAVFTGVVLLITFIPLPLLLFG
jgi:Zn-dependent protease